MSLVLAQGNNFHISSSFGAAVIEGTRADKPQGPGRTITFYIEQLIPEMNTVRVRLEPVTGQAADFWDSVLSTQVGGEPADPLAVSGVVQFSTAANGAPGIFRVTLNADTFPEGVDELKLVVSDGQFGHELISANFLIIDDDAGVVPVSRLGSAGHDTLQGGPGADVMDGDAGNDLLIGGAGEDMIIGGIGNDTIWAGAGDDMIKLVMGERAWMNRDGTAWGAWPPAWNVRTGNSEVWAGDGNDTLIGGTGNDTLGGGAGDDLLDALVGGRNELWGGAGNDSIWAGDNGDRAGGGTGNDLINGGTGADELAGGIDDDTVRGGGGNDMIYLGPGNDMAYGGDGNDTISAGPGNDRLWGGRGDDQFQFWRGQGQNQIEDFDSTEGDVIALGRGLWTGTHGVLTAQQVLSTFGILTDRGDAVLTFAAAGTTVVIVGTGTLIGLMDDLVIL